jgi:hypothetical protein
MDDEQDDSEEQHDERRAALLKALDEHVMTDEMRWLEQAGLEEWFADADPEDVARMVDLGSMTPMCWVPGVGWLEGEEALRERERQAAEAARNDASKP